MTTIIYAVKKRQDIFGLHQHAEIIRDAGGELVPNPEFVRGAGFDLSAGEFSTLCELLVLPNRTNAFQAEEIVEACDAALLDIESRMRAAGLPLVDGEHHAARIRQMREVAEVGLSHGADMVCAS